MNLKHWLRTNEIQKLRSNEKPAYTSASPPRCDPPRAGVFTQWMKSGSWVKTSDYQLLMQPLTSKYAMAVECGIPKCLRLWNVCLCKCGRRFVFQATQSGCSQSAARRAANLKPTNARYSHKTCIKEDHNLISADGGKTKPTILLPLYNFQCPICCRIIFFSDLKWRETLQKNMVTFLNHHNVLLKFYVFEYAKRASNLH